MYVNHKDNKFIIDTITKILKNNFPNIDVDSAENGYLCTEKFKLALKNNTKYLMIFMDLCMPLMDGFEASKIIRELEGTNNRTPIFALSAPSSQCIVMNSTIG
jgi:CheY-like chemotaxis protein